MIDADRTATLARADAAGRRPSPTAQPTGGILALVAAQAKAELVQNLRVLEFVIGVVIFPTMLFLMFGLPSARQDLPNGTNVGAFLMASFGAYGMLGIAIFGFGVDIAVERGRGWLKLVAATPMPGWVYFAGKLAMTLLFGMITLGVLFSAGALLAGALLAGVRLAPAEWLRLAGALLAGGMAFSTLGFTLGYWASPRGASPIANLIYLPLSFASGLFIPLSNLPEVLRDLAPFLPTYHFAQLVWRTFGKSEDLAIIVGLSGQATGVHVAWMFGAFAVFGIAALIGYRRDRRRQTA